jgi:hypothetical protein
MRMTMNELMGLGPWKLPSHPDPQASLTPHGMEQEGICLEEAIEAWTEGTELETVVLSFTRQMVTESKSCTRHSSRWRIGRVMKICTVPAVWRVHSGGSR